MIYQNIINTMIANSEDKGRYRLHGDINTADLEKEFRKITGKKITVDKRDGGSIYQVGKAKFYTGAITRHPSARFLPMIAA